VARWTMSSPSQRELRSLSLPSTSGLRQRRRSPGPRVTAIGRRAALLDPSLTDFPQRAAPWRGYPHAAADLLRPLV